MSPQILIFFTFLLTTPLIITAQETNLLISMFATDLNSCDDLSACDTVVKIMCQSGSSAWTQCGITQEVKDDNFPVFPERFTFTHIARNDQRWRFELIDKDVIIDDPIGSVTISFDDFINATPVFGTMRFTLDNGRGNFFVHRREV